VDADVESKLLPCKQLERFEVVADGETEFRIRTAYRLSAKSTLQQDMVFYADSPRVDFETIVDWNDPHRLLKAAFDVSVRSDFATQEIQYGNLKRSTKRNTTVEQAAFEVCNHKYTDLSEPNYGVAVLNDCKYGIGVNGSNITLTLHKGGARPDPRGDAGIHSFIYAFLPHSGGFSSENAIAGGYELNYPVLTAAGGKINQALFAIDRSNIIAEAIKPCEETQRAFIVRLYEAEGTYTNAKVTPCESVTGMTLCDMLENEQETTDGILSFRPFEIKTIKMTY
jgi:alpha-mannosidase